MDIRHIRFRRQIRRTFQPGKQDDRDDDEAAEQDIPPGGVRPERDRIFLQVIIVPFPIGLRIDRPSGLWWLGYPRLEHQPEMQADKNKNERGNDEYVIGKKSGEAVAADGVSAQQQPGEIFPEERNSSQLLGRYDGRPDAVGIPAQQLPGEPHKDREKQQEYPTDPV